MRSKRWAIGTAAMLVSAALLTGCWPFNPLEDCAQNPNLRCFWSTIASGPGGAGGGGGGTSVECVPSRNDDPVADTCGVFVSSSAGDDANEGTKDRPVRTLKAAIKAANGKPVYTCAEAFEEAVVLDAAVEVFGGLQCGQGWAYGGNGTRTTLTAGADEIPLVMRSGANGARVEDFAIRAADAMKEGGSSIAVLADGATAELVRCELTAGNGAKGAAGAPGEPNGMAAKSGVEGKIGVDACSDLDGTGGPNASLLGGAQTTNECGGGDVSIGGSGGDGNVLNGGGGDVGQTGTAGKAGAGEPAMGMMWSCVGGSGLGDAGSPGKAGMPGAGATGLGALSASGYAGTSGGAGTSGKAGQGGGGGGGAKGGMICPGATTGSGASGGSGGAGGCGGLPGQGGGPGGASIALLSLNASITLTDCVVSAGNGGDGGPGGDSQAGGLGGDAGKGGAPQGVSNPGCDGGKGGKGGNGGPGGGGLGGPSLGIAFKGDPPAKQGETAVTAGSPGEGGPGGSADAAMNAGDKGADGQEKEFP